MEQTPKQEVANTITHGLGLVFSLLAVPYLVWIAKTKGSGFDLLNVLIFGFGLIMVYLSSTIYHFSIDAQAKRRWKILDHISIYLLIGGSYVPIMYRYLDGDTYLILMQVLWTLIAVATVIKIFHIGKFKMVSTIMYLVMGWIGVFVINPVVQHAPALVFQLIVAGGLFYTFGVIFYVWKKLSYHHAVWHLFVVAGSVSHYFAILNIFLS